jgi:hypothetical protein
MKEKINSNFVAMFIFMFFIPSISIANYALLHETGSLKIPIKLQGRHH